MTRTNPRRGARELVMQGLYQRQLSGNASDAIAQHLAETDRFAGVDRTFFDELWRGVVDEEPALLDALAPHLTRNVAALSPVERAILVIGAWELVHRLDIPYRVVINEAVELAKGYGGTDGHRFVNGVLDKFAAGVRADEIRAVAAERFPGTH
jgi:transcription antitermination protein NusB